MRGGPGDLEKGERRPDLYIVARFLERLWLDGKDHTRASLQAAVGLNYNLFVWYMEWLRAKGLVSVTARSEKETVAITVKGLEAYHSFVVWVRETVGEIGPKRRAGNKPYDPPGL